ncbi:M15 family metallopeptidase [Cellulomonas composti]|uniref:D-alanyl-D-alanine carboxypeptidase-like core domain-containing protein n=1 Tax=Cellulomonas composti TaxID=266130 RepID=A0A511J5T2_9CELL|nr:M15 family metallopeptidase [Cellulomonas composti]GEL93360.1 hypothetical protein CCO02nite_00180 [Cellulomonas composti]
MVRADGRTTVLAVAVAAVAGAALAAALSASGDPSDVAAPTATASTGTRVVVDSPTATSSPHPTATPSPTPSPTPMPTSSPTRTFPATDDELAQVDDATTNLVIVNKQRPMQPIDFAPEVVSVGHGHALRPEAAAALGELEAAADADGVGMYASSGYRSYAEQASTYDGWRRKLGSARADELSARAGYSEHQTGLAADMRPLTGSCRAYSSCFADTPQAAWLAEHAYEYGFVVRYPAGQADVTGYDPEPWHIRFVGVDFARTFHDSGAPTLEAYFGLPPAPTY